MLRKTLKLATLFYLIYIHTSFAGWETHTVKAILESDQYLLSHNKIVKPLDLEIPSFYTKNPEYTCFLRSMERFLDQKLLGQSIKIKFPEAKPKNQIVYGAMKFDKTVKLDDFFVSQGWARSANENLKTAQHNAKINKKGLWGQCNGWNQLKHYQSKKGTNFGFPQKYRPYLQGGQTAWVSKVLSANLIELKNGLKIRLIGVGIPQNEGATQKCFKAVSKKYLEAKLIGKKVILEKDISQIDKGYTLWRYVFLPQTKFQAPVFINELMIKEGFARYSNISKQDQKYAQNLESAQMAALQSPTGGWKVCLDSTIKESQDKEIEAPELQYDPDCRIKGNIAGSKKNPKFTYHTPLSGWYKRLKYERCFETELEAESAGFIKVK